MKPVAAAFCAVFASVAIGACSQIGSQPVDETPADCERRWQAQMEDGFFKIGEGFEAKLFPTYAYDVTRMDEDARSEWIGLPQTADTPLPRMSMAFGGDAAVYKAWLDRDVGPGGAYFSAEGFQAIRERGEPVPFSGLIAQGCAKAAPGVELVNIGFAFNDWDDDPSDEGDAASHTMSLQVED